MKRRSSPLLLILLWPNEGQVPSELTVRKGEMMQISAQVSGSSTTTARTHYSDFTPGLGLTRSKTRTESLRVAHYDSTSGDAEIFMMNSDGSEQTRLALL